MIGGDEYLKVARSLLKAEDATDEEIASSTGLRINMVRKVLYDLFGKALITGIRVKDEKKDGLTGMMMKDENLDSRQFETTRKHR